MRGRALNAKPPISPRALGAGLVLAAASFAPLAGLSAQQNTRQNDRQNSVFIEQATSSAVEAPQISAPQAAGATSKVYFPDAITPQSVAEARARAAEQQQLERAEAANGPVSQVSNAGEGARDVAQLSDGDSARALAQLSPAERQVVLDAVEGTDICEQADNIPAIRDLCEGRIETRSAEFAQSNTGRSAEDNLLGGGFDSSRLATLETAINRLAQSGGRADDFSDQAVASVALGRQGALSDAQATSAESDPTSEFSPETQGVINAIVQQLGGGN